MLRNNTDARRCSCFELGLPVLKATVRSLVFTVFSRSVTKQEYDAALWNEN